MMSFVPPSSDFSKMLPSERAKFLAIDRELERRKVEEQSRYLQLQRPPYNDQLGFYLATENLQACLGGNRSGKTKAAELKLNDVCTGRHPTISERLKPPVHTRVVAPKWADNVVAVIHRDLKELIIRRDLRGGSWQKAWSEKYRTLYWDNGSTTRFFSLDQDIDTMGGDDLDYAWFDEHAPQKYVIETVARLIDRNGILVYTFTPERGITWERDVFIRGSLHDKRIKYWEFNMKKNPHISEEGMGLLGAVVGDHNLLIAKTEGKMVPLTGRVYETFSRQLNVIPVSSFRPEWKGELPSHWYRDLFMDPHKQKPHFLGIFAWSPEGELFFEKEAQFRSPQGVNQLKTFIRAFCVGKRIKRYIMDESLGGDTIDNFGQASMLRQLQATTVDTINGVEEINPGIPFAGTNQESDKSWEAGWLKLCTLITPDALSNTPRFYILDTCPTAIDQFESLCWKDDPMAKEGTLREKAQNVNNEAPDIARYAAMAQPFDLAGSGEPAVISAMNRPKGQRRG